MRQARCFAGFWGEAPVTFSAWVPRIVKSRRKGDFREHRTVVLPDYQGIGIGNRVSEFCASIFAGSGGRAFSTTSHPAMMRYRRQSPLWKMIRCGMASPQRAGLFTQNRNRKYCGSSCDRITAGFQYVGPALERVEAERFFAARSAIFGARDGAAEALGWIEKFPGATAGFLERKMGMNGRIDGMLNDLLEMELIVREGRGGPGGRRFAYRAVESV